MGLLGNKIMGASWKHTTKVAMIVRIIGFILLNIKLYTASQIMVLNFFPPACLLFKAASLNLRS